MTTKAMAVDGRETRPWMMRMAPLLPARAPNSRRRIRSALRQAVKLADIAAEGYDRETVREVEGEKFWPRPALSDRRPHSRLDPRGAKAGRIDRAAEVNGNERTVR
jgi:hypothetical protein